MGNLFTEMFKSFRRNIFKAAKVDTDLYNILYELQNEIGNSYDSHMQYFNKIQKNSNSEQHVDCLNESTFPLNCSRHQD